MLFRSAKLPPDQQEKVRTLYGLGATEQAAKVISPDPVKREIVGGQEAGYFAVNPATGESEQVLKGIGRAPTQAPETFSILSPEQVKAMGLPPGTYQMSSRGKLDPIGGSTAAGSPLAKLISERDALARHGLRPADLTDLVEAGVEVRGDDALQGLPGVVPTWSLALMAPTVVW